MKYCPKCGNAVSDTASFCPRCGTNIPEVNYYSQQATYGQSTQQPCPPTYLALSIIVTVLCCIPFGIVGIVKSSNVSREYAIGNYDGANEASKQAKMWSLIGIFSSLFVWTLYILFFVIIGLSI